MQLGQGRCNWDKVYVKSWTFNHGRAVPVPNGETGVTAPLRRAKPGEGARRSIRSNTRFDKAEPSGDSLTAGVRSSRGGRGLADLFLEP
jgi:hypothetical protein